MARTWTAYMTLFVIYFLTTSSKVVTCLGNSTGEETCQCTVKTLRMLLSEETAVRTKLQTEYQEKVGSLEKQIAELKDLSKLSIGQYRSCNEILQEIPNAVSGTYTISTNIGPVQVYCEMGLNGGGYTFLPSSVIVDGAGLDLTPLTTDTSQVLVRILEQTGSQPYTILQQLAAYSSIPIHVSINSNDGYQGPNNKALGPYMFLGFLPTNVAADPSKAAQGFRSNGRDVTFTNCDRNPNSYFATFPNHDEKNPVPHNPHFYQLHRNWRQSARQPPSGRTMPTNYFFFTEIHFGGCGVYTSSDKWTDARGIAIGTK
ncbi:uncharacterized protein LOC106180388 [Lingula anatina]|uniref:Uncharacterized protein LOC106180388 n=1 Tax=Lingula anatina TaxID=7574 RepID=A0A1S3KB08_LINAN|nr:uncharacterized protein LOC106180388 [Lingula anatina]|eukprot:XP_013419820.1 uncharacterized protein LOC106180388 [Lingula anatina]